MQYAPDHETHIPGKLLRFRDSAVDEYLSVQTHNIEIMFILFKFLRENNKF
jgi:hypothetical protein